MNYGQNRFVRNIRRAGTALFLLGLTALLGCGGGAPSVSGKITSKGEAVKGGSITFAPKDGGRPAGGDVQSDGTYSLADRAAPGKYKVTFSPPVMELPPGKELKQGQSPPPSPWDRLVPKQHEVEVQAGSNTIDIELVPPGVKQAHR